jgi:hypothetical protein
MDDRSTPARTAAAERFERLAGAAALGAALTALLYAIGFVIIRSDALAAVALTAGGLLSAVALVGLYEHVRDSAGPLATLGVLLGFVGALGAAVHGAYDLANVIHPSAAAAGGGAFPVDPRGFLTFGVSGLGLLALCWAALSADRLPRRLLYLGLLLGVLLVVIYLGRLIILDASNIAVLVPGAVASLVVSPLFYGWLGVLLLGGRGAD